MPPPPPIFSDAALRLHRSCVEMATALENAAAANTIPLAATAPATITAPRMPSTRPLDQRWDRSRGIIFQNAKRVTPSHVHGNDRSWSHGNGVVFAQTPVAKRYARREINKVPQSTAQNPSISAMDAPYKADFASSTREAEKLKSDIRDLEGKLKGKEAELMALKNDGARKDVAIATLQSEISQLRKTLEQVKADHQRQVKALNDRRVNETEQLNQRFRQEEEARKRKAAGVEAEHSQAMKDVMASMQSQKASYENALLDQKRRYELELDKLQALSSEGLAKNKPALDAVRKEGEAQAKAEYEEKLALLKQDHENQLKVEAVSGSRVKELEAQNAKHARDLARLAEDLDGHRQRANEAVQLNRQLQKTVDGRRKRAEIDRPDYTAYRGLFRGFDRLGYEFLEKTLEVRSALQRESALWRDSSQTFRTTPALRLFRQMSGRNGKINHEILEFLGARASQAHEAAESMEKEGAELRSQIQASKGDLHHSRSLTSHFHFDEVTGLDSIQLSKYLSDLEPFERRWEEEKKKIEDLAKEILTAKGPQREDLETQLVKAEERCEHMWRNLMYFQELRKSEKLKAMLNLTPSEKRIYFHTQKLRDRLKTVIAEYGMTQENLTDRRTGRALRDEERKLRQQMRDSIRLARRLTMYEQELGKSDHFFERQFDDDAKARLRDSKLHEQRLLDVIVGERENAAMTKRARRAIMAASVSRGAPRSTVSDLAATLAKKPTINAVSSKLSDQRLSKRFRRALEKARSPNVLLSRYKRSLDSFKKSREARVAAGRDTGQMDDNMAVLQERIAYIEEHGVSELITNSPSPDRYRPILVGDQTNTSKDGEPTIPEDSAAASRTSPDQASTSTDDLAISKPGAVMSPKSGSSMRGRWTRRRLARKDAKPSQQLSVTDLKSTLDKNNAPGNGLNLKPTISSQAPRAYWPYELDGRRFYSASRLRCRDLRWSTLSQALRASSSTAESALHASQESVAPELSSNDSASTESGNVDSQLPLEPQTVLDYHIPPKDYRDAAMASPNSAAAFWSHTLYKSSQGSRVQIFYCRTLDAAERQLKLFLDEKVLGFDLEWEQFVGSDKASIKKNVSLIQIAAEDKIALIQVALFKGDTIDELMPPSLRTILEDDRIAKAGVNVGGDATRMRKFFGINMCGVFELSHMYRLVKKPKEVNFKLVNLAEQVQNVLLLPLAKSDVRVSAWSRPLNNQQTTYAAADAYAGFQLYHRLDNERKRMVPTPPRPAYYETNKPIILGNGDLVERSKDRARIAAKKSATGEAATADDGEEDDIFFDALEELPETYELGPLEAKQSTTNTAPEAPADPVNTVAYPKLPPLDPQTDIVPPKATPAQQAPKPQTLHNDSTALADTWAASNPGTKVGPSTLRAYHLWHHQNFSVQEVASLCREPPLAMTTVASYIMQAVKEEGLGYERERMKVVLEVLPRTVWGAYWRVVKEVGL